MSAGKKDGHTSGPEGAKLNPLESLGRDWIPRGTSIQQVAAVLMRVCLPPDSICSNLWISGVASSLSPLHSYLMTGPLFIKPPRVLDSHQEGCLHASDDRGKSRILPVTESQHLQ